jgi:hypothetical protein
MKNICLYTVMFTTLQLMLADMENLSSLILTLNLPQRNLLLLRNGVNGSKGASCIMYPSPVIPVVSCLHYDGELHIKDGILFQVSIILLKLFG